MIVISKKRIQIIVSCILIAMFAFVFQVASNKKELEKNSDLGQQSSSTILTTATPVSGKTIVVDARSWYTRRTEHKVVLGTTEAETNLKIALKLQNLLETSGSTVILTRSDENAIYDLDAQTLKQKKISDIHNRVKIGNESSADIFVSIHLNKIPQQQYWGWQCFYKNGDEKSTNLAKQIQSNLNDAIQKENKRVAMKLDTVYIMKHVEIPISIVECGFCQIQKKKNNC